MSKLSDYLAEKDGAEPAKHKAIIKLKLALLVKKMAKNKNKKIESAFTAHLEKAKTE